MAKQVTKGISLDYDLHGLKSLPELMKRIRKAGGRVEPPLKQWGAFMLSQTHKTFQNEGRGNVKWEPLSALAIIMRGYRKRGSGRTGPKKALQDTGHLKRSIKTVTFKAGKGELAQAVFTRVPYADTHQEGGKMTIKSRTIKARKAKALRFEIGGEVFYRKSVTIPEHTVDVPQRQFLFISTGDKRKAVELMQKHRDKVVEDSVK